MPPTREPERGTCSRCFGARTPTAGTALSSAGPIASSFERPFAWRASAGAGRPLGTEAIAVAHVDTPEDSPLLVEAYVRGLPDVQRIAVLLRHVYECSIDEIADLTRVSPNTVKDRLLRAHAEQIRSVGPPRRHEGRRLRPEHRAMRAGACQRWIAVSDARSLGARVDDDDDFARAHEASCRECSVESAVWRSFAAAGGDAPDESGAHVGPTWPRSPATPALVDRVLAALRSAIGRSRRARGLSSWRPRRGLLLPTRAGSDSWRWVSRSRPAGRSPSARTVLRIPRRREDPRPRLRKCRPRWRLRILPRPRSPPSQPKPRPAIAARRRPAVVTGLHRGRWRAGPCESARGTQARPRFAGRSHRRRARTPRGARRGRRGDAERARDGRSSDVLGRSRRLGSDVDPRRTRNRSRGARWTQVGDRAGGRSRDAPRHRFAADGVAARRALGRPHRPRHGGRRE